MEFIVAAKECAIQLENISHVPSIDNKGANSPSSTLITTPYKPLPGLWILLHMHPKLTTCT